MTISYSPDRAGSRVRVGTGAVRGLGSAWWVVWLVVALGCVSPPIAQQPLDFAALDAWSVHVVTEDPDGDERVARIWIVALEGEGYIRTKSSRWFANLERGSWCRLRVDGREYPVQVEFITDPAVREQVDAAFHARYGWQERLVIGPGRAQSADPYMRLRAAAGR